MEVPEVAYMLQQITKYVKITKHLIMEVTEVVNIKKRVKIMKPLIMAVTEVAFMVLQWIMILYKLPLMLG